MSPIVMPNGGGDDIGSGELIAYNSSQQAEPGNQTPAEQAVTEEIEAKAQALAATWADTTPSVDPLEVLARAGAIQSDVATAIRQWARPGTERRMLEMIGSLLKEITKRDRELLELRARLDASPY